MRTENQPTIAGKLIIAIRDLAKQHIPQPDPNATNITLQRADFLQEMMEKRILISIG